MIFTPNKALPIHMTMAFASTILNPKVHFESFLLHVEMLCRLNSMLSTVAFFGVAYVGFDRVSPGRLAVLIFSVYAWGYFNGHFAPTHIEFKLFLPMYHLYSAYSRYYITHVLVLVVCYTTGYYYAFVYLLCGKLAGAILCGIFSHVLAFIRAKRWVTLTDVDACALKALCYLSEKPCDYKYLVSKYKQYIEDFGNEDY